MRPDMSHVIAEAKTYKKYKRKRVKNHRYKSDDIPRSEKMRPNTFWDDKNICRLKPFINWLNSRCGQQWDKVYSELSKVAINSAPYHDPKHWAKLFVEQNCYVDKTGTILTSDGFSVDSFYVDPTDNTLRTTKIRSRR